MEKCRLYWKINYNEASAMGTAGEKAMRKYWTCLILVFLLAVCGCGGSSEDGKGGYLDNLQETYTGTEAEGGNLFPELSKEEVKMYITDFENHRLATQNIEYAGERLSYKLITNVRQRKEDGPENFNEVFFILIDGELQPFYFEDADEPCFYASLKAVSSKEKDEYVFSFDPLSAPYGKCSTIAFVLSSAPECLQDNGNEIVNCYSMAEYYTISSTLEKYEILNDRSENMLTAETDFMSGGDKETGGCIVAEKITDSSQLGINTVIDTDKKIYMTMASGLKYGVKENVRVFAVMDGKPADVFNGKCYGDLEQVPGTVYECPLDTESITKDEKHQIYFIKFNKADLIYDIYDSKEETKDWKSNDTLMDKAFCVLIR